MGDVDVRSWLPSDGHLVCCCAPPHACDKWHIQRHRLWDTSHLNSVNLNHCMIMTIGAFQHVHCKMKCFREVRIPALWIHSILKESFVSSDPIAMAPLVSGSASLFVTTVVTLRYGGADATDINAVSRDASGRFLVTADDRGLVRLLNYPVVCSDAPSRSYLGHSAHVTSVRCSEQSPVDPVTAECNTKASWVATCGGGDRAVFQFKLLPNKKNEDLSVEDQEAV